MAAVAIMWKGLPSAPTRLSWGMLDGMFRRLQPGSIPEWIIATATAVYAYFYVRTYYRQNPGVSGVNVPWLGLALMSVDVILIGSIVWRNRKIKAQQAAPPPSESLTTQIPITRVQEPPTVDASGARAALDTKSRASSLADEIDSFLKECGPNPHANIAKETKGMSEEEFDNYKDEEKSAWVNKICYSYPLRFEGPVNAIQCEFGILGITDLDFNDLINAQIHNEKNLRAISEKLRIMAGRIKNEHA